MYKETIICIITIIIIICLNITTGNYTKEAVSKLTYELMELRKDLLKEDTNNEELNKKVETIFEMWNNKNDILSYYLEHDELEKVKTNLTSLRGEVETQEYSDAVSEVDRVVFVLQHIENKNKFKLKNIF